MAYTPQHDVVSGEQYRYALTNFRIAHEKVEEQRVQLQEQEKQVAQLRARIALLEGTNQGHFGASKLNGNSVDDFSIKNAASGLERQINRWAAELARNPPVPLNTMRSAALTDVFDDNPAELPPQTPNATGMQVQSLLRHTVSKTIAEGIINCLVITDSPDANIQLARIHEHIFSRAQRIFIQNLSEWPSIDDLPTGDPTVAAVWRRQTFSAAVETCSLAMSLFFLSEHMPNLQQLLEISSDKTTPGGALIPILEAAYDFSRMLHSAPSSSGGQVDAFYRAFVPDVGSTMNPRQIELVKRCQRTERGEPDRVGATVFPGLVKVTRGVAGQSVEASQTVVRRAQVICECALLGVPQVTQPAGA